MSKRLFAALFSISVIVAPVMSQTQPKDQQDTQKEKRMEWFANAKLGIFIHWGIYSVISAPVITLSFPVKSKKGKPRRR
jgi:alpha-L-fucosidase